MIKLLDVSFKYKNGPLAIKNVNLEIKKGEIVMLIGQNGSGKSTLLALIAKLYKYKGEIFLGKENIRKVKNREFRKKIGIVFQNPNMQMVFSSVYENFKFVINNLGLNYDDDYIKETLKIVGMEDYMYHNPYNLSLGQKERIAIALVLLTNPQYILLDEVTSMIDSEGKEIIYNLIKNLKNKGIGIIMSTNILEELVYADRIVILNQEIKEIISKKELLKNIEILTKYNFKIPLNLKIINKLANKINLDNINDKDILEYICE